MCALLAAALGAGTAPGAPDALRVSVAGLEPGNRLPLSSAFCAPASVPPAAHNISPAVSWSPGPAGTRSYVLIMTDLDVPADLSLMNKPGVEIALDAPRVSFIHWVLIDIPPSITHLDRGIESEGYAPGPRPTGPTDHGVRGANVYSNFFPKGTPLAGPRGGYDGPCPPRNDPKPHRYVTKVYALDIAKLGLDGVFYGEAVEKRLIGHVLAEGESQAYYGPFIAR
jgi:Raf kinase inhibitor-like YbhB/YbcL family protein